MLKEVVMECDHVARACAPRESRECATECEVEGSSVRLSTPNRMGLSLSLAAVPQNPNRQDRRGPPCQTAVFEKRVAWEPALCCGDGHIILRWFIPGSL
jgi:hypothetical protein